MAQYYVLRCKDTWRRAQGKIHVEGNHMASSNIHPVLANSCTSKETHTFIPRPAWCLRAEEWENEFREATNQSVCPHAGKDERERIREPGGHPKQGKNKGHRSTLCFWPAQVAEEDTEASDTTHDNAAKVTTTWEEYIESDWEHVCLPLKPWSQDKKVEVRRVFLTRVIREMKGLGSCNNL